MVLPKIYTNTCIFVSDGLKIYRQFSDRPYYWGKYVSSYSQGTNYLYYILNNLGLTPTVMGTYRLFIKDTQSTACAEYFVCYKHGNTFTVATDFELEMHLNAYNIQGTMDFSNISSYSNLQCFVEIISVY